MNKVSIFQNYFILLSGILPAYLLFAYPYSVGGSFALCFFILFINILLPRFKAFSVAFVMMTVVLTCTLIINFLSYLECTKTITVAYVAIFCFVTYLLVILFILVFCWPYKLKDSFNESEQNLVKEISKMLKLPTVIISLFFTLFANLMVLLISDVNPHLYKTGNLLRGFYIGFAIVVFGFLISYIYLNKIEDKHILNLISEEKIHSIKLDASKFKKWYLLLFCWFVLIGSGIEILRNMWPIWIETILLVGTMSMILWKIYKHLFQMESLDGLKD